MEKKSIFTPLLLLVVLVVAIIIIVILGGIVYFKKSDKSAKFVPNTPVVRDLGDISIESKEFVISFRSKTAFLSVLNDVFHTFEALPGKERKIQIIITTNKLTPTEAKGEVKVKNSSKNGVYISEMEIPRYMLETIYPEPQLFPLNLEAVLYEKLPSTLPKDKVKEKIKELVFKDDHFILMERNK